MTLIPLRYRIAEAIRLKLKPVLPELIQSNKYSIIPKPSFTNHRETVSEDPPVVVHCPNHVDISVCLASWCPELPVSIQGVINEDVLRVANLVESVVKDFRP
jgi:hypothetical protein